MRVFVAGATGVLGRPIVRKLVEAGHAVIGSTRKAERAESIRAAGAEPVVCDALDARGLAEAVLDAKPEVVIHALTDIPRAIDPRRYGEQMAGNDRLRVAGSANLVLAARAAGARRIVAESIAFAYAPEGRELKQEDDPLFDHAPEAFARSVAALRSLEAAVLGGAGIEGVVLRFGMLYGPGTAYARDGHWSVEVKARRFPMVGDGSGVTSFLHVEDAADATLLALERGTAGIYNIVDDVPMALGDWLPALAAALGAKPPLRVPAFVARVAAGALAVTFATAGRGASNAKARRELGWTPRHPSFRDGIARELAP